MRRLRLLLVFLVTGSLLNWSLPTSPASAAPVAPGSVPAVAAAGLSEPTATIQVTVEGDQYDDPLLPASATSGCSLREALTLLYTGGNRGCGANKVPPGAVTIKLPPGDIQLSRHEDLPFIPTGYVVSMSGPNVSIDGGRDNNSRNYGIFKVEGGTLKLSNLTLHDGSRPGGGALWLAHGTIIADKVTFKDNDAAATPELTQNGGAILAEAGDITVTNSTFENNVAEGAGGAVSTYNGYFYKDTFVDNQAGRGGAFYDPTPTTYTVTVDLSKFTGNKARATPFDDPGPGYQPYADIHGGGAIANDGTLQVLRTLIENNQASLSKGGGGVYNQGSLLMSECVLTKNTAVANGSGDSNTHIKSAYGGAVINYGLLDMVRCSIYDNTADYAGAIFNHGAGILSLYNTTVTNNKANTAYPSLMNDLGAFGNTSNGATIRLVHTTVGKNESGLGGSIGNALYAEYNHSVYFANSILDAACISHQQPYIQYSQGGSISSNICTTILDPAVPPTSTLVIQNDQHIGLGPLTSGTATVAKFMVQPLSGNSDAAGIGLDNKWTCNDPHILHRDANLAPRTAPCDAGAIQVGSVPPKFTSDPPEGTLFFPDVDLAIATRSYATLTIKNSGGGAMDFQILLADDSAKGNIVFFNAAPTGTLDHGQSFAMTLQCIPPAVGDYFVHYVIKTNAPNRKQAAYEFHCTGINSNSPHGQASVSSPPGAFNMPQTPGGQLTSSPESPQAPSALTFTGTITLTNPGPQSLTVNYSLADSNPMWSLSSQIFVLQGQTPVQGPASPAVTLGTGQSLQLIVSCAPPGFGMFVNTLLFATTDPTNPQIHYDLACERPVNDPPEGLQPSTDFSYNTAIEGVAVSPDGAWVLAGDYADNQLRVYGRFLSTGSLLSLGSNAHLAGWSKIYGIAFSHDGQNAYFTSQDGNGIARLNTSNLLAAPTVMTKNTLHFCGFVNGQATLCPIGTMAAARGLAVSPDDQYVYVTGYSPGDLTVFQRNAVDGGLTDLQSITRTIGGVNVLGGAARVTTSPDGSFVYVAAMTDNDVAVFERNTDGTLTFESKAQQGANGVHTLGTPTDLAVSSDGNYLYAAAQATSNIDTFSRSSADGGLSLSSVITIPATNGTWGVAVSGDVAGRRVFMADWLSNTVKADSRASDTGALSGIDGYHAMDGPVFIGASPDNLHLYVSRWSNATFGATGGLKLFQTVENAPVLNHFSPASTVVNSGFSLTVVGGRFYANSQIVWNGTVLPTTFIDENTLQAAIPAVQVNAVGNPNVVVRNPAPGGGDSAGLPFAVVAAGQPLVPSIQSVDPPEADFGGGTDLTVLVLGANFAQSAAVYYNRQAVPTVFINDHTLQITLGADILTTPGDGGLQVVNGGGAPTGSSLPDQPAASTLSTVIPFRVNAPGVAAIPTLDSLSPATVDISTTVWITVLGHGFSDDSISPSVGRWNAVARPSVVIDADMLLMQLNPGDLAKTGTGRVTVLTPGAGETHPLIVRILKPWLYLPIIGR